MRKRRLLEFAAGCLCVFLASPAPAQNSLEFAIKAAYLAKFVPFIDWPASAFATPGAPVNICVLGTDPFGVALDRAAAAGNSGRPLAVRRLASPELTGSCHILYLADDAASLPAGFKDRPVVTVSEAGRGGMISFLIQHHHVRFDIDDEAAFRSGVRI